MKNSINPKAHRLITFMIYMITDLVLKEVDFTSGSAGASSRASNSSFGPELAFQQDATNANIAWDSGLDERGSGPYVRFPHLIWYRFRKPIVPGRVSFGPGIVRTTKHAFANADKTCIRECAKIVILKCLFL